MWAGPAQTTGPGIKPENSGLISAQKGWADIGPTDPFFSLFLGQVEPKWFGPRPHGCWPDPATMQSNYAACRTRVRSTYSNKRGRAT